MQAILTYLTILLSATILHGQNTINVTMTHFDNDKGKVMVGLYDTAGDFLDKEIISLSSKILDKEARVSFEDIPDGVYAVSCYHDEDSNGKLNMFANMFPIEDYGTSNNAPAFFGPPKWEDAKFEIKNGQVISLEIKM